MIKWEKLVKEKQWIIYSISLACIIIIEIADLLIVYFATFTEQAPKINGTSYNLPFTLHNLIDPELDQSRYTYSIPPGSSAEDSLPQHPPHHLPVSSIYNLFFVYLFLPISRKGVTLCLGMAVSVLTVCSSAVSNYIINAKFNTSGEDIWGPSYWQQLGADITFHICVNLTGFYVRYVSDINMRRGFLDKRGCIETTFRLKYEKEQEENLLLSIIPKHIVAKVGEEVKNFIIKLKDNSEKERMTEKFSETFLETHKNVSILYADICNFTPLTEKFTSKKFVNGREVTEDRIEELVATLNDLFTKFDEAAERHNCNRIKILGDCYYCISGLPSLDPNDKDNHISNPNHAKNSVDMGLEMIDLIREVREDFGVPGLDMRIGVHTGRVLSGLIGLRKWQFDIWSNDVTIANHMESSGKPGHVHITEKTRDQLNNEYTCREVDDMSDQVILDSGLRTFLIRGKQSDDKPRTSRVRIDLKDQHGRQFSEDSGVGSNESHEIHDTARTSRVVIQDEPQVRTYETSFMSGRRNSSAVALRRTSFSVGARDRRKSSLFAGGRGSDEDLGRRKSMHMDSSILGFKKMIDNTETFMEEEIEQLPIRIQDQWFSLNKKKSEKETEMRNTNSHINNVLLCFDNWRWISEYVREHDPLFKWYITASFVIINCLGVIQILTSYNTRPHVILWVVFMVIYTILLALIPATWISYIWDQIIDPQFDLEHIEQPDNKLIKFFYKASGNINTSVMTRNVVFVVIGIMTMLSSVIDLVLWTPCMLENPRNYTYRAALSMMIFFTFIRTPHLFKIALSLISLLFYFLIIFGFLGQSEELRNPKTFFSTESFGYEIWTTDRSDRYQSHFAFLIGLFFYFLLLDRQNEYIHLLDFQWKRQLKDDQAKARNTKIVNKILLQNILPQHVADVYLTNNREHGQLFSESYFNVAVMFASLPNYIAFFSELDDTKPLNILHEIISKFDQLMYEPQFNRIEKIKIIGSTFMAACGLLSGRKNSQDFDGDSEQFSKAENSRMIVRFAAAMMRSMQDVDYEQFQLTHIPDFKLRTGVCSGKVIAGVVGAQKPLYDIWGDTVNIASRMDYTGERGYIHVPQMTARQLMNQDVNTGEPLPREFGVVMDTCVMCQRRGDINVKGKGIMTTYFVELNEDLDVVETSTYNNDVNEEVKSGLTSVHVDHFIDEDDIVEDRLEVAEKYDRIDVKKDSGFGSQGHMEIDKIRASSEILAAAVSAAEDSDDHNDEHETEDIGELNGNNHDKNIVHRKVDKRVHYDIHDDNEL